MWMPLITLNMFGKSFLLTPSLCFPAERVLHQLPAASPGSAESDNRWRRQQVFGRREQQTQAAGVQLRSYQAHEAHLDVHSGEPHPHSHREAHSHKCGWEILSKQLYNAHSRSFFYMCVDFDLISLLIIILDVATTSCVCLLAQSSRL